MVLPADDMVALSVHAYMPYQFALNPKGTALFHGQQDIDKLFDGLTRKFVARGIPVVLGEWGALHKNNLAERIRQAAYYSKAAARAGIPTIVWDNGVLPGPEGAGEAFGLLDRRTTTWVYPELMAAIVCPAP